ncbi:MAG: Thiol-disulfide oxidoreductase ResA [Acidobacteria bacterium ADurb.Bin340]|nr:MAG: Thiol-disulfide oxidoreductase ResA [Acidobacteria bacterium ADurb.Bin340]HOD33542.1 redoxin domain-containing protein [Holophaga sp.]HQL47748.1 redoxin domain-containing protein [Holophaga sp.]
MRSCLSALLALPLVALPLLAGGPQVGQPAPAFTLTDTQGRTLTLEALKGKVVVLEWTNPGCPFVVRHYGAGSLQALQAQAQAMGAVWITVNSTNPDHKDFLPAPALQAKLGQWKTAAAHVALDAEGTVGKAYEAKTTPHLFVIDAQGKVAYMGGVDDDPRGTKADRIPHVAQALEALKVGKPLAVTTTAPYGCSVKYR